MLERMLNSGAGDPTDEQPRMTREQAIDDLVAQLSDDDKRALVARLQGELVKALEVAQQAELPQSPHLDQVLEQLLAEGVSVPDPREVERRVKAREAAAS